MERPRFGEKIPAFHRKQRYFKKGNCWYYYTREGKSVGPYNCLTDAIFGCSDYVKHLRHSPSLAQFMSSQQNAGDW